VLICIVIVLRLGWISVAAVFVSFFFMSILLRLRSALRVYVAKNESRSLEGTLKAR